MISNIKLPYEDCKNLIKESDVLLFKGKGLISWLISRYTNSPYSHAGLAHWNNDNLFVLEFREFKGSRIYPLSRYVSEGQNIDVFRCVSRFELPYFDRDTKSVLYKSFHFTPRIAQNIIKTALEQVGIEYSWWTIVKMAGTYIPFVRLHKFHKTDDEFFTTHSFVCSTLVTYSYRRNFIDPVPFLADRYTTPGDLARCALFYKIFEIVK